MLVESKLREYDQLLQKNAFGFLATTSTQGPHVTPLWIKYDDNSKNFLVNIEENSVKDTNIQRDPLVCLNIVDPDNPYHYLFVRGKVIERVPDDGTLVNYLYTKYSEGKHTEPWFGYTAPLLKVVIEPLGISGWKRENAENFRDKLLGRS